VNRVLNGSSFKTSRRVDPGRLPVKKSPGARDSEPDEGTGEGGKGPKGRADTRTDDRPAAPSCLILRSAVGIQVKVNIGTVVGRAIAACFDRHESLHWDHSQLVLERDDSGWFVAPRDGTRNETMLNGKRVKERMKLNSGDILGVGREAKGVVKLPLTVFFE
jgi:hypothetical protein